MLGSVSLTPNMDIAIASSDSPAHTFYYQELRGVRMYGYSNTSHLPRFALAIHFSEFYTLVVVYLLVNTGAYL